MNRIILIGNDFDLAHGLKTSYTDFIDDLWEEKLNFFLEILRKCTILGVMPENSKISRTIEGNYRYNDNDIKFDFNNTYSNTLTDALFVNYSGDKKFINIITQFGLIENSNSIQFNNNFLGTITEKQQLKNWVDIEEEYYLALIKCLEEKSTNGIIHLNKNLLSIQEYLENYLKNQSTAEIIKSSELEKKYFSFHPMRTQLKPLTNII
jgi:hypothetical protein